MMAAPPNTVPGGPAPGQPITTQPGMAPPPVAYQCPPGLEPLVGVRQLFVRQAVNFAENIYNAPNHYDVFAGNGARIYHVSETTNIMMRQFDTNDMPYNLVVFGYAGQPVLQLAGQPACCGSPGNITVYYGGFRLGAIQQVSGACCCGTPVFNVLNSKNQLVLQIVSETVACCTGCGGSAEFRVVSVDGKTVVGKVSKMWGGLLQETLTNADNFGVSMPADLDLQIKALLMSTAIMIDFQFFNQSQRRHHHHGGGYGYGHHY